SKTDFTQGELRQTDRDLDLAIDGEGFLTLLKDGQTFFARTGSFEIGDDGVIRLQGSQYQLAVLDAAGRPTSVSIDDFRVNPPKATTKVSFADNLSTTATDFSIPDVQVYDASGKPDAWQIKFTPTTTAGEWTVTVSNASGEIGHQTLKFNNGVPD